MAIKTMADIEDVFSYHAPTLAQQEALVAVRTTAKEMAEVILNRVPDSADRSAAFRLLRECVMTSNAAIVLEGRH